MKFLKVFFICLIFSTHLSAQTSADEILRFKARIGFTDPDERIVASKFLDDGRKLVLVGRKNVQFWDVLNAKLINSFAHSMPDLDKKNATVVISADGKKAIAITLNSAKIIGSEKKITAGVYDLQIGRRIAVLERPTESIRRAFWSKNGETIITYSEISSSKRTEVCFWDGESFGFRAAVILEGTIGLDRLSQDGKWFLASTEKRDDSLLGSGKTERNTAVWNTETGEVAQKLAFENDENPFVYNFYNALSPNEKYFAANRSGKVFVWEIGGGNLPKYEIVAAKSGGAIFFKNFTDDGKYLLVSQNKALEFYDAASGELKFSLPSSLSASKSYEEAKLLNNDATLFLQNCERFEAFDLPSRRKLYEIKLVCKKAFDGFYSDFDILRFHPTERLLLTFSDREIRVWDTRTGALAQKIADPNRAGKTLKNENGDGLKWSADWLVNGKILYAASADGKNVLFWELKK